MRVLHRLRDVLALASLLAVAGAVAQAQDQAGRAEVVALNGQGQALLKQGDAVNAAKRFEKALDLAVKVLGAEDLNTAGLRNNLALAYQELGDYAKAEPLYVRSLEVTELKLDSDHPQLLHVLNNLALLYKLRGKYAQAEPLYQRCLEGKEERYGPSHEEVALTVNNLALLYEEMGQYDKAERLLQRSLKIWEDKHGPDHPEVATALNNLAELSKAKKDYARAEAHYQRSLRIWEKKNGPDDDSVAIASNNLASLYSATGQLDKAESLFQRSLKIWEGNHGKDHPHVAAALNNLGALREARGDYGRAELLYRDGLKIKEAKLGPDHPDVAASLKNLAVVYAARGDLDEALPTMDRSRRIMRRQVSRVLPGMSEVEQLTFLQANDRTHFHLALALGLAQPDIARAAATSAAWVLNGKAVAQQALAERTLLARDSHDADRADTVAELLLVRKQLATLTFQSPPPGQEDNYRQQLARLAAKEQEFAKQLGRAAGRPIVDTPWVEVDEVRRSLPADAVLIEIARFRFERFGTGGARAKPASHYAAWIIPPPGKEPVRVIDLGEANKIEAAVQDVRRALQQAPARIREVGEPESEQELHQRLRVLSGLVLEPLREHIGSSKRWLLSPDADLWLVPWAALPLPDQRYAIEKHEITYLVSGRDLVRVHPKVKTTRPMILADPDYDLGADTARAEAKKMLQGRADVATVRGVRLAHQLPRVPRLPGTAAEAKAIKPKLEQYAGEEASVFERERALEGVFKAVRSPRVLVLSTHGFFLEGQEVQPAERPGLEEKRPTWDTQGKPLENPLLRCGLLLAGCNNRDEATEGDEDGILTGLEIAGTDLRGTELVVLSACETGLGQVRNGEGVAGLRQAFQLAGARDVVATLWQIPDLDSARLMIDFFQNLADGQGKANALRSAQLARIAARRQRSGAAHPFFWAAFTLTGEGPRVPRADE
jgi:CHAT domain-containing protein/Tfp pilus assembly protein PilF